MLIKILAAGIAGFVATQRLTRLVGFGVNLLGAHAAEALAWTGLPSGSLDLGAAAARLYEFVHLLHLPGLTLHAGWWEAALRAASLVSSVLTGMDWDTALRGTLIDLALMAAG